MKPSTLNNKVPKELRYERKFLTEKLSFGEVKHIILHNPAIFSETYYRRQINNIYLDSQGLSNYHENMSGNAQRMKIRIRWYGKLFGKIESPKLELKIKNGELGKKLTFKLKPFHLNKTFSFKALFKETFGKSNLPPKILELLKQSKLALLSSYERSYFISSNKKFRITVDNNLTTYHINNSENRFIEKHENKHLIILELKYLFIHDIEASEITAHIPLRLTACSKYIKGMDLLHL